MTNEHGDNNTGSVTYAYLSPGGYTMTVDATKATTTVLFNDGWLAGELRRLGVEVSIVDESRHTSFAIVRFLYRFFREHDVDVVHTHRSKDNVLGTIAAKLTSVPHVIRTVHGLPEPMRGWDRIKFAAYQAIDRATLYCFADRIVAVSRRMADVLYRSGYRRSAITHLHNGIDVRAVYAYPSGRIPHPCVERAVLVSARTQGFERFRRNRLAVTVQRCPRH